MKAAVLRGAHQAMIITCDCRVSPLAEAPGGLCCPHVSDERLVRPVAPIGLHSRHRVHLRCWLDPDSTVGMEASTSGPLAKTEHENLRGIVPDNRVEQLGL